VHTIAEHYVKKSAHSA